MKKQSRAMQLIEFVKEHKIAKCPWSRERAQHIDDWVWELAVRGGFEFWEKDLGEPTGHMDEGLYSAAIQEENTSAIKTLEYHAGRKPFIAMEVSCCSMSRRRMAHMAGDRKECRLAVGFQFRWDGKWVTVTSFANDHSYVVACSYGAGSYNNLPKCEACGQTRHDLYDNKANKPEHIYKITIEELRAGRALKRRRHPKCKLCLEPIEEGQEVCRAEHHCEEWQCKKIITSTNEGRRVPCRWLPRSRILLCNDCIAKQEGQVKP